MFLAIHTEGVQAQDLCSLSSKIMCWSDDVLLVDITPCYSYWETQAKRLGKEPAELFRELLLKQFGEDFRAVLAVHPWQAILLLTYMRERELWGFVNRDESFGARLYRDISWESFWLALQQLAEFFELKKYKRFKLSVLKRQLLQMQSAVDRLGVETPWKLHTVGSQAIRRRYGNFIKTIWEWSYPEKSSIFFSFPWHSFKVLSDLKVVRNLDHPLFQWDHLEEILREDFDKLCCLDDYSEQLRIVSLELCLTLHDTSPLPVPVLFRHPHNLHQELHTHRTALLQAYYNFEKLMREKNKQSFEDTDMYAPPIIGWELRIKECLVVSSHVVDLFGDVDSVDTTLRQLENRLSVDLKHFDLANDWSAEESFTSFDEDSVTRQDQSGNDAYGSMQAMVRQRPLFIYNKLQPLKLERFQSALWEFRERTMNKWWAKDEDDISPPATEGCGRELVRDYYRYTDAKQRSLWVYRNDSDRWYVHGIFA